MKSIRNGSFSIQITLAHLAASDHHWRMDMSVTQTSKNSEKRCIDVY